MKNLLIFVLFLVIVNQTHCQVPPDEFFNGLELYETDRITAKQDFLTAIEKEPLFHGSYHFLGVIYLEENLLDSSITCFRKSIQLNKTNLNQTRVMAYVRLYDAYLLKYDFLNSYKTAWEANELYPDNDVILQGLKNICLWSFYIKHNGLDSSYLSHNLKKVYIVNSVPEEYLILGRIIIDNQNLVFQRQALINESGVSFDILSCELSESKKKIDVKFRLNWNLNDLDSDNLKISKEVYKNKTLSVYERIGGLLVSDSMIDIEKEIKKIN